MPSRSYWLDLFTPVTWEEFLDAGAKISGFRESRWTTLQKVKPGDYFLCYVTGISRWVGVLEVVSEAYKDTATVWKDEIFPCRVKVKIVAALTPETGIPVMELKDRLTVFQNLKAGSSLAWPVISEVLPQSGKRLMEKLWWKTSFPRKPSTGVPLEFC